MWRERQWAVEEEAGGWGERKRRRRRRETRFMERGGSCASASCLYMFAVFFLPLFISRTLLDAFSSHLSRWRAHWKTVILFTIDDDTTWQLMTVSFENKVLLILQVSCSFSSATHRVCVASSPTKWSERALHNGAKKETQREWKWMALCEYCRLDVIPWPGKWEERAPLFFSSLCVCVLDACFFSLLTSDHKVR